jgi:hypothetical protein
MNSFFNSEYTNFFYTTERLSINTGGSGGPFGFDIQKSIEFNLLVVENNIDIIVETGTNIGDTTEFLAKLYPNKKIITCETNRVFFGLSKKRLEKYPNVEIYNVSSDYLLERLDYSKNICFYLDAHWEEYWPLPDELKNIKKGIIMTDDFYIGSNNYGFDKYNNTVLSKELFLNSGITDSIYCNNPFVKPLFPILQERRIAGRGFTTKSFKTSTLDKHPCYMKI